jgi:hypothetical protein
MDIFSEIFVYYIQSLSLVCNVYVTILFPIMSLYLISVVYKPFFYMYFNLLILMKSCCSMQTVFATDLHSRIFLQLPKSVGVDFRAS